MHNHKHAGYTYKLFPRVPTDNTLNCRNANAFSGTQAMPDTVAVTKQVCQHSTFDVQPT